MVFSFFFRATTVQSNYYYNGFDSEGYLLVIFSAIIFLLSGAFSDEVTQDNEIFLIPKIDESLIYVYLFCIMMLTLYMLYRIMQIKALFISSVVFFLITLSIFLLTMFNLSKDFSADPNVNNRNKNKKHFLETRRVFQAICSGIFFSVFLSFSIVMCKPNLISGIKLILAFLIFILFIVLGSIISYYVLSSIFHSLTKKISKISEKDALKRKQKDLNNSELKSELKS